MITHEHTITLTGLDGGNPLAFLAALGIFRTFSNTRPAQSVKLSWTNAGTSWNPVLHLHEQTTKENLLAELHEALRSMANHPALTFSNNLRIPHQQFRKLAEEALAADDSVAQEFVCAFGCDAIIDEKGDIEDTALRTMSGAGHQHFLKFMNELAKTTEVTHLEEALFGPWRYQDIGPSLRFDPLDDRRYALRWKNPSQDASTSVRGANRLAIEGIPLFPTLPVGSRLETTGFTGHKSNNTFWTWPIWEHPISLDPCRSLLSSATFAEPSSALSALRSRGIAAVFRSQRITIGKFRNFTPARAV